MSIIDELFRHEKDHRGTVLRWMWDHYLDDFFRPFRWSRTVLFCWFWIPLFPALIIFGIAMDIWEAGGSE